MKNPGRFAISTAGLLATLAVLLTNATARADDCKDRLVHLIGGSVEARPARGLLKSEIKGGPTSENEFLTMANDHNLFKPIKPANMDWVLTYKGGRYTSSDQGKSWKKVQSFDPDEAQAAARKSVSEQAQSAKNVTCAEGTLDGKTYDTIEAELSLPGSPATMHNKYWIDRNADFVVKSTSLTKMQGFESLTTQTWQLADDLSLPTP